VVVQVGTPEEIIRNPANDYVESFFRDVNVGHVFKAGDVARRRKVTLIERRGSSLRAAMSRLAQYDDSWAIVHDRQRRYLGMVSLDSLEACIKDLAKGDDGDLACAFLPDVPKVDA